MASEEEQEIEHETIVAQQVGGQMIEALIALHPATALSALQLVCAVLLAEIHVPTKVFSDRIDATRKMLRRSKA